jgi:cell division septal protein FtsQ
MPPRRQPPPAAEEPFAPTEPWWRRSSAKSRRAARGQERAERRFQIAPPQVHERPASPATAAARISAMAVAAIIVSMAVIAGLAFLVTTDWLAVTRASTEIRGAERVSKDAIYAASRLEGVNVFQVQPERVAQQIKQAPGIAEAVVHVRLPYQATIIVREEVPFMVWQGITMTTWLAENGMVVPALGAPPGLRLMDLTGAAAEQPGKLRPHILTNLKALQMAGLEVTDLYYGAQEGIYFRSPEGWTVYLGNDDEMGAKLAALRELRSGGMIPIGRARIIDLRDGRRAHIR